MVLFSLSIIIIILGLIVRGRYFTINNFTNQKIKDFNKWFGINIILTGVVLFFYGIMIFLGKTTLITHLMLVIIISLLFVRIFIGPGNKEGK